MTPTPLLTPHGSPASSSTSRLTPHGSPASSSTSRLTPHTSPASSSTSHLTPHTSHALVTGGAGFIGSHLVDRLLADGWRVTTLDNFDPFYDPAMKRENIAQHLQHANFRLVEMDIRDDTSLFSLEGSFDVIVHLAAKAGVRPSIADPIGYQRTNVQGTQNMLEFARQRGIKQFVFASSSSVYGINPDMPWREDQAVLRPISPYAATKVAGELLGHVYSHLYGIRFIALRFFTVYGPRQRPDLAIHKFARLVLKGRAIPIYGDGSSARDYTYISDIVEGILAAIAFNQTSYEVMNLGNSRVTKLLALVASLEETLKIEAQLSYVGEQPGDAPLTCADISRAQCMLGYEPATTIGKGIEQFVIWLRSQLSEDCEDRFARDE